MSDTREIEVGGATYRVDPDLIAPIESLQHRVKVLEGALDRLILACPSSHTTAFLLAFQNAQRLLKNK